MWYNEKKSCLDLLDGYVDLGYANESRKERLGDQSFGVVSLLLQLRKRRLQRLWIFLELLQLAAILTLDKNQQ